VVTSSSVSLAAPGDTGPSWQCEVRPERDAVRVLPAGALDMVTVPLLRGQIDELREAGFRHLILDLGRLDFMDSCGLRLILAVDAESHQDGFVLSLAPGPRAVQRVFEVTGTSGLLPF
jgi:anti-sigma B factor antagonist